MMAPRGVCVRERGGGGVVVRGRVAYFFSYTALSESAVLALTTPDTLFCLFVCFSAANLSITGSPFQSPRAADRPVSPSLIVSSPPRNTLQPSRRTLESGVSNVPQRICIGFHVHDND
jgi:hypothetical protein